MFKRNKLTFKTVQISGARQSKDPAKRARQLENLKNKKGRGVYRCEDGKNYRGVNFLREMESIIGFAESQCFLKERDEGGNRKLVRLFDWQKGIFKDLFEVENDYRIALIGCPKKSGKTEMSAIVGLYFLLCKPEQEIFILGSKKDQGLYVLYDRIVEMIKRNKAMSSQCKVLEDSIRCELSGSTLRVLSTSQSEAGINPDLVLVDELWSFVTPEKIKAFNEIANNIPNKKCLIFITSYAGHINENSPLLDLYRLGVSGETPELYFLWRTDYGGMPWGDEVWLLKQRKLMSDNNFRRLFRNEWVESSEVFISEDIIKRNTVSGLLRGEISGNSVFVGVDIGTKDDCSACAVCGKGEGGKLRLFDHRVWKIVKGQTLDIEVTVEAWIRDLRIRGYRIGGVIYDPSQFIRSSQALAREGFRMREFSQSGEPMIKASETLKSLLNAGRVELYESSEIKEHLLNAAAKDTGRGIRIIKGMGQAKKIDLAIALSMSVFGASERYLVPVFQVRAIRSPARFWTGNVINRGFSRRN